MDGTRFDRLTRELTAGDQTRRHLLRGLAAAALGGLLVRIAPTAAGRQRDEVGDWEPDAGEEADAAKRGGCARLNRTCDKDKKCCGKLTCKRGRCRCPKGTVPQGGRCVPKGTCRDDADCGGGKTCQDGICACPGNLLPCADGCIQPGFCCGAECLPSGGTCEDGACVCPTGTKPCGLGCAPAGESGCCGDLDCPAGSGKVCVRSKRACACPSGKKECAGVCIPSDRCCSDADCGPNRTCNNGICGCSALEKPCNGTCISQSQCCGGCSGGKTCQNGACACPSGQAECGGTCCPFNEVCQNGTCRCPSNRLVVDGRCVRPCTTTFDCGGCGCASVGGSPTFCHGGQTDTPCQTTNQCSPNEICMDFVFGGRVCGQICA